MVPSSVSPPTPPNGLGPQVAPPLPFYLQAIGSLRSSFVFARSLQHFWLPASHLLGTCYLLGDLRSTHTPSKYLRATYRHIYIYTHVLCIYFLFTTCVLWQHYTCLTYTVPTIHSNDAMHTIPIIPIIPHIWKIITRPTIHTIPNIHAIHTIPTLHRKHSIPIIATIHSIPIIPIIHTIHLKHNYHAYHTYNTKHTCHKYHTYLT